MTRDNKTLRVSTLACSLAGHDKGRIYAVIGEDETGYYLCDGVHHLISEPKKKNRKHVQPIRHLPQQTAAAAQEVRTDSEVIHLLRVYRKETRGEADACQNLM